LFPSILALRPHRLQRLKEPHHRFKITLWQRRQQPAGFFLHSFIAGWAEPRIDPALMGFEAWMTK
jgi:hypothetical protein